MSQTSIYVFLLYYHKIVPQHRPVSLTDKPVTMALMKRKQGLGEPTDLTR